MPWDRGPAIPVRALVITLCVGVLGAAGAGAAQAAPRYVPGHVNVVFQSGADAGDRARSRSAADVTLQDVLGRTRFQSVQVEHGQTVAAALRELRADPDVVAASRDVLRKPLALPNDPYFADGTLWGLRNKGGEEGPGEFENPLLGADIGAVSAWDKVVARTAPVIADLDSGYYFDHEDLRNVFWTNQAEASGTTGVDDDGNGYVDDRRGWDFVGADSGAEPLVGDNDPADDDPFGGGHGSHTAGTIAARGHNGLGAIGVAQANPNVAGQAKVMALRVCGPGPDGPGGTDESCPDSASIKALNYAAAKGVRVANMSLGGESSAADIAAFNQVLVANKNLLVVAAAGNENTNNDVTPSYPCNSNVASASGVDNVICVAATDQRDRLATAVVTGEDAGFSNYGRTSVDLGAPGTEILSTVPRISPYEENFEDDDPFTDWTASAGAGRFAVRAGVDEDGKTVHDVVAKPGAGNTRTATSPTIAVPAGLGTCRLAHTATFREEDEYSTYSSRVQRRSGASWVNVANGTVSAEESGVQRTGAMSGLAGQEVRIVLTYTADVNADFVAVDDFNLSCLTGPAGYEFQQGTSMATPHVTGAAGLLFALNPTATVTEVRAALLSSVDARPTLANRTVTGGRLNVSRALDALVPAGSGGGGAGAGGGGGGAGGGASGGGGGAVQVPAPAVVLSLGGAPGSLTVDAKGRFSYSFTAKGTGAGSISFTTQKALAAKRKKPKKRKLVLGRKSFRATADGKVKVTVALSGRSLRALRKAKRLGVSVRVELGSRKTSRALTLKAPKAKKKR